MLPHDDRKTQDWLQRRNKSLFQYQVDGIACNTESVNYPAFIFLPLRQYHDNEKFKLLHHECLNSSIFALIKNTWHPIPWICIRVQLSNNNTLIMTLIIFLNFLMYLCKTIYVHKKYPSSLSLMVNNIRKDSELLNLKEILNKNLREL